MRNSQNRSKLDDYQEEFRDIPRLLRRCWRRTGTSAALGGASRRRCLGGCSRIGSGVMCHTRGRGRRRLRRRCPH